MESSKKFFLFLIKKENVNDWTNTPVLFKKSGKLSTLD